jgi:hypothetical protein
MKPRAHSPGAPRSGLRLRGARGNAEVRAALIRYARWLRTIYDFPIRLPVYLLPGETFVTREGERVTASFFAPDRRDVEPYARIATGDYPKVKRQRGRDDALAAFICSLSHEVLHYRQWMATERTSESGIVREARRLLRQYSSTVRRP